jgi:hypothetical protein
MPEMTPPEHEVTSVDDVRRVREKIARDHGGDLLAHVRETNRIAAELRSKLNVKPAPPSPSGARRTAVGE